MNEFLSFSSTTPKCQYSQDDYVVICIGVFGRTQKWCLFV